MWRAINFVAGFLLGAVLGAAIVVLTTPQSGQDLRAGFQSRFGDLMAVGRDAAATRRAELEARLAAIKDGG
ncbi:MAG: hypothetical protein ACE5H9_02745 [Anaerolineae bacterium]